MSKEIQATCPFCSLHCTDLRLTFDGGKLSSFTPECVLGETGYRRAVAGLSIEQPPYIPLEASLKTARVWLQEARQPLIVLSGNLDGGAVSAAVRLAQKYSAILTCEEDITGSVLGLSIQTAGFLTTTLGELRWLDLAILGGVDPAKTHPRLGVFLGRDFGTESLCLDPPDPLETIRWLRLAGLGPVENLPGMLPSARARIVSARSGLVVFGMEWLKAGQPFATELLLWLTDLNREKRWYALYLPPASNSNGVVEALLSETGHPGNLRFGPEGINASPRLWRAECLIQQGNVDLCLLAGQPGSFSEASLSRLAQSRTILIDSERQAWESPVWIPSAQAGVDAPGNVQRLDGVPVSLQPVLSSQRIPIKNLLLELM